MSELMVLVYCLIIGILLGLFFFGGLWWTLQKGLASKNPALWFVGSGIFRMFVVLVGFYYIGNGSWQRTVSCLAGFTIARCFRHRISYQSSAVHEP